MTAETWEPDRADPGYVRHCVRPDCGATYNALDVMNGLDVARGWRMFNRVIIGQICPAHAGPVIGEDHHPTWLFGAIQRVAGIGCTCGWEWRPGDRRATQGEHQEQWVAHLMREDAPPARLGEDGTDGG